ncbi:MAG TPA: hypothetical protein VLF62_05735 [Candidatus Saccharimonadales bacterium]|nr:hypothetical protein [Candidatus Saccharimonadales bacterium]
MSKIKKGEAGFSVVEVVLILVVVALVGVAGFMMYKNHNKAKDTATKTSTSQTAKDTSKDASKEDTAQKQAAEAAVVVPEWGIKIAFEDADKVTYTVNTDDRNNPHINLNLKDSVASVCQSLGVGFSRSTTSAGETSQKVGDYYYQLGGGPGVCDDDPGGANGSINQLRSKIISKELGANKYTVSAQ